MIFLAPAVLAGTFIPAAYSFRSRNFMLMPEVIAPLIIVGRP